jgi:hypothetical protein
MSYDPLNPSELDLLTYFNSLPAEGASTPGDDDASSSSSGSDSERQQADDDAMRTPPPPPSRGGDQEMTHVKAEPNSSLDVGRLDNLGDLDMANLTGGIDSDAAFLDSLGLGTSSSSSSAAAPTDGINAPGGIGDVTASVFHPLDLAGRPIADLSLLGPANLDSLASLPGFDGFMGLDLGPGGGRGGGHGEEEDEEDARPFPAWNNEADIPSYVT